MSKKYALIDAASLLELVTVSGTRKAELYSNASADSSQRVRTTTGLRQPPDTLTTQSKELSKNAQHETSGKTPGRYCSVSQNE